MRSKKSARFAVAPNATGKPIATGKSDAAKPTATAIAMFTIPIALLFAGSVAPLAHGQNDVVVETNKAQEAVIVEETKEQEESRIRRAWEKVMKEADEHVEKLDFEKEFKKDALFSDDLSASVAYGRGIQPSYIAGDTTLVETYTLKAEFQPEALKETFGDWSTAVTSKAEGKFTFARQFKGNSLKDKAKIFAASPYTPYRNLPWNSERALSRLKKNDFVSYQSSLNLVVSASQLKTSMPHIPVTLSGYYAITGEFQVHMFRLDENRFRFKVIGVRSKNAGANLTFGFTGFDDLEIFKVDFLDKQIRKKLKFTPLQLGLGIPRNNLFMVDYVLDLKQTDSAEAYDQFISSILLPKKLKMINPLNKAEKLREMLLADVAVFDELHEKENGKPEAQKAISRIFKGEVDGISGANFYVKAGHDKIANGSYSKSLTENDVRVVDDKGYRRVFQMPAFTINNGWSLFFGRFSEKMSRTALLLLEKENEKIDSMGELSFYLDYRDNHFQDDEIADMKNFIRARLPQTVYQQIDWKDWGPKTVRRGHVNYLLVIRPNALTTVEELSGEQIREELVTYLKSLPEIKARPSAFDNIDDYNHEIEWTYRYDIAEITSDLTVAFRRGENPLKRKEAFLGLRWNRLFQEIGSGFLVHLVGEQRLAENIYFETVWDGKDVDTVHFTYGNCRNRRLYKSVMYAFGVIQNRSLDMRLMDNADAALPGKNGDSVSCN